MRTLLAWIRACLRARARQELQLRADYPQRTAGQIAADGERIARARALARTQTRMETHGHDG